jgi:hypothetical protein
MAIRRAVLQKKRTIIIIYSNDMIATPTTTQEQHKPEANNKTSLDTTPVPVVRPPSAS